MSDDTVMQGAVWTVVHTHETAPFPREHVERKRGPLTPVSTPTPDDDFMAAVRALAAAAMASGVALALHPQREELRAALAKNRTAMLSDALAPFVESLLTIRPSLVDDLRKGGAR